MKLLNRIMLLTLLAYTIIFLSFCKHTTEPPPNKASITLKLEDVSCTEAWITLKLSEIPLPATVTLYKNNAAQNNILCYGDTLLYIDSLLPKQSYKFKALLNKATTPQTTSNELSVETMDTTSHNFTWQSWTFGTIGSSSLYDVAIIDENNIWAVGEIKIADTSINGYTTYNAVHWNGSQWELKKIGGIGGWACHTVFAFSASDIWFEGNIHWDGSKYTVYKNGWPLMPNGDGWRVNKMWGSSSSDLYAVGNGGNIAHWDGVKWRKIESGTDLPIRDIWGDFNNETNSYEILAIAAEVHLNKGSKVLSIKRDNVIEENNSGLSWDVGGLWFKANRKYYIAGAGIHYKHLLSDSAWIRFQRGVVTNYPGDGIRGKNINDLFTVGSNLEIVHFNGVTWYNYQNEISSVNAVLSGISIYGNMITAVGFKGRNAIIVVGRRN